MMALVRGWVSFNHTIYETQHVTGVLCLELLVS